MLQILLQANCPVQVSAEERGGVPLPLWGALFHACHKGYGPKAVKMLLSHGADMLEKDIQKMTPLASAANQGTQQQKVMMLIPRTMGVSLIMHRRCNNS